MHGVDKCLYEVTLRSLNCLIDLLIRRLSLCMTDLF